MNTVSYHLSKAPEAQTDVTPSKVICIGRNYVEHAKELGNAIPSTPIIFLKPNSSICSQLKAQGVVGGGSEAHHYESELSFLVKQQKIYAVGFGLDLTRRQTQQQLKEKGLPWERAKAFDGSAVFSHFVPVSPENVGKLWLRLTINDVVMQQGGVDMMLFKPDTFINEVAAFLTLEDNDILMSGTPKGVGAVQVGDCFIGEVFLGEERLIRQQWLAV